MKNTCEKTPIFVGGVVISYLGSDIPSEVIKDIKELENNLSIEVQA